MRKSRSGSDPYRQAAFALVASVLVAALGVRPRATAFDRLLTRAALAAASGQPVPALAALDQVLAFDPALASLHLAAAQLAWQSGDSAAMARHLQAAPADVRRTSAYHCLQSYLPERQGTTTSVPAPGCPAQPAPSAEPPASIPSQADLPASAASLRAELAMAPDNLPGWERLAALTELTQPAALEPVLLQAYRSFPQGSKVLDGLWQASHQADPSLALAQQAARTGQLLAAGGDWALAGAAWQRAVDLDPSFAVARAYLGVAQGKTGADGLPHLLRAAAEAPDDPTVRMLIGQYWLSVGDAQTAAKELEYAQQLDTRNPAIAAALGSALAQSGRMDAAAEAYQSAAALAPQEPSFWLLLAEFSLRYGFRVDSIGLEAARNAVALAPQDPAALSALGMTQDLAGDPSAGERLLARAIALDPSRAIDWYRYALTLLDQGRTAEARQALSSAVALDPDGPVARLASGALSNLMPGL